MRLVGEFQAWAGPDCPVDVTLKRARLLLAYLALAPSGRASREEFMALLWSERGDAQARQSLRQTIAVIRSAFSATNIDLLRADLETVAIDLTSVTSDVATFNAARRHAARSKTSSQLLRCMPAIFWAVSPFATLVRKTGYRNAAPNFNHCSYAVLDQCWRRTGALSAITTLNVLPLAFLNSTHLTRKRIAL